MKIYIWILLAIGIIGFIGGICRIIIHEKRMNKGKTISLLSQIITPVVFAFSIICIMTVCILPYDTSQSNWNTSLNMNTDTIEINKENEYIEINRNDNGFIKKEKYYFTGEIKGKFNNQESKQKNIFISAKEIKQTYLFHSDIEKKYLTDVKIEYANE